MSDHDEGGGASRSTDPASGSSAATDFFIRASLTEKIEGDRRLLRVGAALVGALAVTTWFEIQRRLENLNHEAARIQSAQNASVSADTYKSDQSRLSADRAKREDWEKNVNEKLTTAASREDVEKSVKGDRQTNTGLWLVVAGIIVAVVIAAVTIGVARQNAPVVTTPTVTVTTPGP